MRPILRTARTVVLTCVVLGVIGAVAAASFIWSGIYPIEATAQHPAPLYWVLTEARDRAIAHHAKGIGIPNLDKPEMVSEGLGLFKDHCQKCHGAPGVAPDTFATGMRPVPPPLVQLAREQPPNHLYWVIANGIKMTGMPSWKFKLEDKQMWSIVAFLEKLPKMSPPEYRDAVAKLENNSASFAEKGK